ncbi:ribosomal protein L7/L12 [uncultured Psychroserpens sp.]|uniref:ribosomal protein L7/L12 n=1 Tax=uncultured Psychroserpens sp. TaxID=255436 RepID=UPI0026152D01|nr:ribosomal protein L7/L12 [uncultured Psychroserpens sp.]
MTNYFKTYKDYFWHWESDYEKGQEGYVATIRDGQSIAYFPQVYDVLEDLAPQGLPPFGAILLVMIATNQNIDEITINHLERILLNNEQSRTTLNAIEVLDLIRELPYRLKTGSNLTLLFQTLFKDCHNRLGKARSKELLQNVANDYYQSYITAYVHEEPDFKVFHKDIRAIALLIRRFKSTQDIINAMQNIPDTDISETVELEEQISNENDIDKSFVEQLTEHKNTYQIGSLIKRIWSGLNIPMHHNLPSSQPLGGVSDITNKGDFSRLLISEFAYEDDTFMSRIANNEALYIERETPPETNDKHRVFLIDASLKNWGIPKVLSFATSLAIAQHPKSDYDYSAYIVGEDYKEAPIKTVYDVIDSQQILSGGLHPSEGLTQFFGDFNDNSNRELFFLTEAKNLEQPELQNVLYAYHDQFNYIITTQTSGAIDFYKHQNRSRKHFQHILLPYEELWETHRPKVEQKHITTGKDIDINHLLLEPIDTASAVIIPFEDTYYLVQNENLYTLTSVAFEKGIQLVYEGIPYHHNNQFTMVRDEAMALILVCFNTSEKRLSKTNLKTKITTGKQINNVEITDSNTVLFSEGNNIVLTDDKQFWNVTNDSKLFLLSGHLAFSKSLDQYRNRIYEFRQSLRIHKVRYNILKNINQFSIKETSYDILYLLINDFILENDHIKLGNRSRYNYVIKAAESHDISQRQDLILKRTNGHTISIIKYLNDNKIYSLKDAKELVSIPPCTLFSGLLAESAETLKKTIEDLGATCYVKTAYYESKDGSTIHIKNGQLIFNSSKDFIPTFYITSVINQTVAMATDGEFAGNSYFLPVNHKLTVIEVQEFYKKYINPFLKHILDYED